MGSLVDGKLVGEVVRIADRREWVFVARGQAERAGSRALVIGYGTIGRLIGHRLAAFDVAVTGVTRSGRDETLTTDRWRARLSEFDWVILAAPSTGETKAMLGADQLAGMNPGAWLVNIARGVMVAQAGLNDA